MVLEHIREDCAVFLNCGTIDDEDMLVTDGANKDYEIYDRSRSSVAGCLKPTQHVPFFYGESCSG